MGLTGGGGVGNDGGCLRLHTSLRPERRGEVRVCVGGGGGGERGWGEDGGMCERSEVGEGSNFKKRSSHH